MNLVLLQHHAAQIQAGAAETPDSSLHQQRLFVVVLVKLLDWAERLGGPSGPSFEPEEPEWCLRLQPQPPSHSKKDRNPSEAEALPLHCIVADV